MPKFVEDDEDETPIRIREGLYSASPEQIVPGIHNDRRLSITELLRCTSTKARIALPEALVRLRRAQQRDGVLLDLDQLTVRLPGLS
jgi:hypothetical protein